MFDPKAKPEETQDTSRLIDELNERLAIQGKCISGAWEVSLLSEDTEPLPSMFRRDAVLMSQPEPEAQDANTVTTWREVARKWPKVSDPTASVEKQQGGLGIQVIAVFFLFMLASSGLLVLPWTLAFHREKNESAVLLKDGSRIEIAALHSLQPVSGARDALPSVISTTGPSLAEGNSWPVEVQAFQESVAEKSAWQTTVIKQAENDHSLNNPIRG